MKIDNDKNKREGKAKDRVSIWILAIVIFLLIFLFLIFQCQIEERNEKLAEIAEEQKRQQLMLAIEKAQRTADSVAREVSAAPSPEETSKIPDSNAKKQPQKQPQEQAQPSVAVFDTVPPVPSMLPPAGRYYKPIDLRVECGEPKCETEISIGDSLKPVKGKIEGYGETGKVYFRAIDSAGNASHWETAVYDMAGGSGCAENSYPVPVNGKTICVDAYEFPNRHGEKPRNMVSQNSAAMLCESAGKRLCAKEEWQAACQGNANLRYPYGNAYDQTKCATDLKSAKEPNRSGFAEHCRSYYGMYDMSGNLWEWTSTPAKRDFFWVVGGTWNTQNASGCAEAKFSFYPQNEYPSVGFRCCK